MFHQFGSTPGERCLNVIASQDLTRELLEALRLSSDAFLLHRADGFTLYANPAARAMIHVDPDALGWPYRPTVTSALVDHIIPNIRPGQPWSGDIEIRDAHGTPRFLHIAVSLASLDRGSSTIMVTAHDVTARRRDERENAERAFTDELTGLPNRAALKRRLDFILEDQQSGGFAAALFVDLDRFKAINDTLGHHCGDELLTTVASRLATVLVPGEMLARLGGDEFVIVLEGEHRADVMKRAEAVANGSLAMLTQPVKLEEHTVYISASIGIALSEAGGESAPSLLRHADVAMFKAKNTGRSRIVHFTPDLLADASRSLERETALHRALDSNAFEIVYQPICRIVEDGNTHLSGFEALVRWRDEEGHLHVPGEFLDVAEQSDLIASIDTIVMNQACLDLAAWSSAEGTATHSEVNEAHIAVNVSTRQLSRPSFLADVVRALSVSGLAPDRLVLEVTEASLMADVELSRSVIESLKDLGVSVTVDRFGTGNCSLHHLRTFGAAALKFDRTFVDRVGSDPAAIDVITAMVRLASSFGMDAIVAGVETVSQLTALTSTGCFAAQGFVFDRPLTAAVIEQRWEAGGLNRWATRSVASV
jgi:diguanylate cyclase (GGDEF)-like protein